MSVQRLAGVTAAFAGTAAFAAPLAVARDEQRNGPGPELVGAGTAAAGTVLLGGGLGVSRVAEHLLRPGLARFGRASAATGAALLAGSIAGMLGAHLADRVGHHRTMGTAREDLDAADELGASTQRLRTLEAEAAPATVELQVDDGRIDLVGAPVSAVVTTLLAHYDLSDDGLTTGDQQRSVGDRTYSIGTVFAELAREHLQSSPGTPFVVERDRLAEFLSTRVDGSAGGRSGIVDVAEARAWYAENGPGEADVTWHWDEHLDSIAMASNPTAPATDGYYERTWSISRFSTNHVMLALPGIDTASEATTIARHAAIVGRQVKAVVELPADAPTRYALATLRVNDTAGTTVDPKAPLKRHLDPSVVAVSDGYTTLQITESTGDRRQ